MTRGPFSLAVVAAIVVAAVPAALRESESHGQSATRCRPHWQVVAHAGVPALSAIVALRPNDVWAVGGSEDEKASPPIVHWDGHRIHRFTSSSPAGSIGELNSVAATAPDDVWAVGVDSSPAGRPVVMHWDGRRWTRTLALALKGSLNGVVAVSRVDAWAVGRVGVLGGSDSRPLVLRWNGRAWRRVSVPAVSQTPSELAAVTAVSDHDIWAVGEQNVDASMGLSLVDLILRWNGKRWYESALDGRIDYLVAVDTANRGDVWTLSDLDGSPREYAIRRWDGRQNRTVYSYAGGGELSDLAAVGRNEAWIIGQRYSPDRPIVIHWDGKRGHILPTPFTSLDGATLHGLSAISPTDIWAAGNHLIARYSC